MKFSTSPPYAPYCDFSVNLRHCINERQHDIIYLAGVFTHTLAIIIGCYTLFRFRNSVLLSNHTSTFISGRPRLVARPMLLLNILSTCCIVTRLLYNTLCAFDLIPRLAVRAPLFFVSVACGYLSALLFAVGIIEMVHLTTKQLPNYYTVRTFCSLELRILPGRLVAVFLATFVVCPIFATITLSIIAGMHGDVGDWDEYVLYRKSGWCIWGLSVLCIGMLYGYYAFILSGILRNIILNTSGCHGVSANSLPSPLYEQQEEEKDTKSSKLMFYLKLIYSSKSIRKTIVPSHSLSVESTQWHNSSRTDGVRSLFRTLLFLMACFTLFAIVSFAWGISHEVIITTPVLGDIFECVIMVFLWPALSIIVVIHRWRTEMLRENLQEQEKQSLV
ncbi:hypothetical protein BDF22DRAFT_741061 [Syncephalis plumigaleata]|nr:hypothetical protein BDF22DRAFT_741061 [Syncephalis plumigaleata]